jgi:hypothetical protein
MEWNKMWTGPLSFPGFLNHLTWVCLLDDAYASFPNPSASVHSPHIEISPIQISATMPLPILVPPDHECCCKIVVKGSWCHWTVGTSIQLSAVNLHTTSCTYFYDSSDYYQLNMTQEVLSHLTPVVTTLRVNSGCNERQRLEGDKAKSKLVKRKEYRVLLRYL